MSRRPSAFSCFVSRPWLIGGVVLKSLHDRLLVDVTLLHEGYSYRAAKGRKEQGAAWLVCLAWFVRACGDRGERHVKGIVRENTRAGVAIEEALASRRGTRRLLFPFWSSGTWRGHAVGKRWVDSYLVGARAVALGDAAPGWRGPEHSPALASEPTKKP